MKGPGLPSGVAAVALAAPPDKIESRPALVAEAKSTAKQAAMQIASTDGKTQKHPPEARDTGGKRKVLVTIPGVGSAAILEAMVGKIVRDPSIRSKYADVEARHGYFLRPRVSAELQVDHVCECQFLGHAVVQSPAFSAGGGSSILAAIDISHARNPGHFGLSSQPKGGVAYNALRPLFNIQNCVDDASLFNLRLLDGSLNSTKGHVFHAWLNDRRAGAVKRLELREAFSRSQAHADGRIDDDLVAELATALESELRIVEDGFYERLETASDSAPEGLSVTARLRYKERYLHVAESMKSMFDDCRA